VQKMQTAFGPSRLDRIGGQAPCFRPWGFLGASGGDAFSKACSRAPPRRGPEGHFAFALEISVDWGCLGEAFWQHFPLFFGGLIFSGILMDFWEGPAAGGACPLSLFEV